MLFQFGFSQVLDYLYKPNIYGQSPRGEREHHGCPWYILDSINCPDLENPSLSVNAYFYMSLHRLTDAQLCHRQIV